VVPFGVEPDDFVVHQQVYNAIREHAVTSALSFPIPGLALPAAEVAFVDHPFEVIVGGNSPRSSAGFQQLKRPHNLVANGFTFKRLKDLSKKVANPLDPTKCPLFFGEFRRSSDAIITDKWYPQFPGMALSLQQNIILRRLSF
jgi:hypothetical protein